MYRIVWSANVIGKMGKLQKALSERIFEKMEHVSKDPFRYVEKMKGINFYKARFGKYRIIMKIENEKMIIFVVDFGHRKIIYKKY